MKNKAEYNRQQDMLKKEATSQKAMERARANYQISLEQRKESVAGLTQSKASLAQSEAALAKARANLGAPGDDNASIREAQAALREAELDFEFTRVKAPVDGYVTNLNLQDRQPGRDQSAGAGAGGYQQLLGPRFLQGEFH